MRDKKSKRFIEYLPVYGCYSTGIIYVGIGVVAILSFLKIKKGGADESSLLAFLHDHLFGKIVFWMILLGTVCYIGWRIFETIRDPYAYGNNIKGIAKRSGVAMSTVPDILIVFAAIQILAGTANIQVDGQPIELRNTVDGILQKRRGDWLVIAIGSVTCLTALIQFFYGITRGYKERLDIMHFSARFRRTVHFLAWAGYLARGIIVGIIGFFFIKAGMKESATYVIKPIKHSTLSATTLVILILSLWPEARCVTAFLCLRRVASMMLTRIRRGGIIFK